MDTTASFAHEYEALRLLAAIVDTGELRPGSLLVACADQEGNSKRAIAVDEVPADPPQHSRVRALAQLMSLIAELGHAGVLLAVARTGEPQVQGGDLAWHDAFASVASAAALTCHGTYLVTPGGIRRVRPRRSTVAA